jgi:hypothetical protein
MLAAALAAAVLTGCFGSDDEVASDPPAGVSGTLSGTAAVGAPVAGGTVDVRCAGGAALQAVTQSNGAWSVTLSGHTLPCAVRVSGGSLPGGQVLVSVALQLGTVNVTPLTHLLVAMMTGSDPAVWFAALAGAANAWQSITAQALSGALATLRSGLNLPALNGVDPVTTAFVAQAGNVMDDILEALADALAAAGMSFGQLVAAAQGGSFGSALGSLPSHLATAYNNRSGGGSGGGSFAPIGLYSGFTPPLDSVAKLVGSYTVGIFRVPEGQESLLGEAQLIVAQEGSRRSMELKKGGTRVVYIDNDPARTPVPDLAFQFYNILGDAKIYGVQAVGSYAALGADFSPNGLVSGGAYTGTSGAGGAYALAFRNGIVHYGPTVPAVFAALAGNWSGQEQANLCGKPPRNVTITSGGQVTITGLPIDISPPTINCGTSPVTVEATWSGNDDVIVPHQESGFTGYKISLKSGKSGGSNPGGGIDIYVTTLESPTAIHRIEAHFSGTRASFKVPNPSR